MIRRRTTIGVIATVTAAMALLAAGCAGSPQPGDPAATESNGRAHFSGRRPRPPARPPVRPPARAPSTTPPTTAPPTTTPRITTTTVKGPTTTLPGPTTTLPEHVDPVAPTFRAPATLASAGGCEMYPPDHFLNANNVATLRVHAQSATWSQYLGGRGAQLKTPSSKVWDGARSGIPLNIVDSRVIGKSDVILNPSWTSRGYHGKYPIPSNPRVQGHPSAQWDRHLLILDSAECMAYELIQYEPMAFTLFGVHTALSGMRYPVTTTERPRITTNAANTPMVGQYIRVDEVNAGKVPHVLGFCSNKVATRWIWPAQASDGRDPGPTAIPMGAWGRLKPTVRPGDFSGQARPIVEALRNHGMILTDVCKHNFSVMGENSDGWNDADLAQLGRLSPDDFEFVDTTPMKISDDSFEIR